MCARHGAYYRQMAEEAHEGLRGAAGPTWRERLTSELGNLRAALDWFIARGDADAALSLASGMAWLWSSTATLSKEHAGLVTRSARRGRAALNWQRRPRSSRLLRVRLFRRHGAKPSGCCSRM